MAVFAEVCNGEGHTEKLIEGLLLLLVIVNVPLAAVQLPLCRPGDGSIVAVWRLGPLLNI